MNDYKNLKLIETSSPHIRGNETTRSLMLDVIIAMIPALAFAVWQFGLRALTATAVSVVGCIFWEWLYRKLMKKPQSVGDLSAVVSGMLIAFVSPADVPYFILIIGDLFAMVIVKQLFGGIGKNFINPALAARAFMLGSYAAAMTHWVDPAVNKAAMFGSNVDIVTAATPLSYMKGSGDALAATFANLKDTYSVMDMFLGKVGGSLGEVSALMLILGGAYLIVRKVINWQIPVGYLATVAVLTFLFPKAGTGVEWMLYNLFGGGLMLGAFFMATDYATSPITKKGQLIFGIGCGLLTVFIRYFGSYNEGVCYSIMIMNLLVALIDKNTKPARFGVVKSEKKKEAAAK
ncbi:MAG: RnfABCDGE type electron transport complex subunit D [Oscillibacter sp.]